MQSKRLSRVFNTAEGETGTEKFQHVFPVTQLEAPEPG